MFDIHLIFYHEIGGLMVSSTEGHFGRNDQLIEIFFVSLMKISAYQAFVLHYDGFIILFPFLIPIFLLNSILVEDKRRLSTVFFPDILKLLLVVLFHFDIGLKSNVSFKKSVKPCFSKLCHENLRVSGIARDLKS